MLMGKRFDSLVFPGGKSKACTFSYDDGVVQDRRLSPLLRGPGSLIPCQTQEFHDRMIIYAERIGKHLKGLPGKLLQTALVFHI